MNYFLSVLRTYPELALFLTLCIGYTIGKIKIGSFKVGAVTGVLLTGVAMGQLNIDINSTIKSVFFLLFLFSLGYKAGPEFFKDIKKNGLSQVFFTMIVCTAGLIATIVVGNMLNYNAGQAAGLASGALTQSSTIGVSQDAISKLSLPSNQIESMVDFVPVGYAVTYIFGTIGAAFIISVLGPIILGVDLAEETRKYEDTAQSRQKVSPENIEKLTHKIGVAGKQSHETDVAFLGLGIFLGGLIGIPALKILNVSLTLSLSGGVLVMGLIFGLWHSKRPNIGHIPEDAIWFLSNVGLTVFIAVVGINAGPSFVSGIKTSGVSFFFAGIIVTTVPILVGILVGRYIFKWPVHIILGACCGAMTSTPSLGMLCEKAKSNLPVVGYTVPYAIGNILLTLWGTVIMIFFS